MHLLLGELGDGRAPVLDDDAGADDAASEASPHAPRSVGSSARDSYEDVPPEPGRPGRSYSPNSFSAARSSARVVAPTF